MILVTILLGLRTVEYKILLAAPLRYRVGYFQIIIRKPQNNISPKASILMSYNKMGVLASIELLPPSPRGGTPSLCYYCYYYYDSLNR